MYNYLEFIKQFPEKELTNLNLDGLLNNKLKILSKQTDSDNKIIYIVGIYKYELSWHFLSNGQPTSDIYHLPYNNDEPCPVCNYTYSISPGICPANELIRTVYAGSVRLQGLFIEYDK